MERAAHQIFRVPDEKNKKNLTRFHILLQAVQNCTRHYWVNLSIWTTLLTSLSKLVSKSHWGLSFQFHDGVRLKILPLTLLEVFLSFFSSSRCVIQILAIRCDCDSHQKNRVSKWIMIMNQVIYVFMKAVRLNMRVIEW